MATWNVLSLALHGYREAIARELQQLDIDIACLTEARLADNGKNIVEVLIFLKSGGAQHHHGVRLVLLPRTARSLKIWEPISDRLLTARLVHRHGHMTILVPYAPTEDASDADKDNFYGLLEDTVHSVPPHNQLIIATTSMRCPALTARALSRSWALSAVAFVMTTRPGSSLFAPSVSP